MKNKNLIIVAVLGLIILIVVGMLIFSGSKKEEQVVTEAPLEEQVATIKPEEIGLTLELSSDGKEVILGVANTEGISGLDYELSYTSEGDIPRGVIGHIDIKSGKSVKQEITLGTCSDVCHYDEDVSDIKLILKVAKTDGTTVQVEQSL